MSVDVRGEVESFQPRAPVLRILMCCSPPPSKPRLMAVEIPPPRLDTSVCHPRPRSRLCCLTRFD